MRKRVESWPYLAITCRGRRVNSIYAFRPWRSPLLALGAGVGPRLRVADHRSPDEIRRTENLYRRGPALGLDDLPDMRQHLDHTAQMPGQQQRARTYIARLRGVEESLHRGDWSTLRSTARETLNDATHDY